MEPDRYIRITLRIPRELHARLDQEADRTSKSLNAEIVNRLDLSFSGRSLQSIKPRMQLALMESRVATIRANRAVEELRATTLKDQVLRFRTANLPADKPELAELEKQLAIAVSAAATLREEYDKVNADLSEMKTSAQPDDEVDGE